MKHRTLLCLLALAILVVAGAGAESTTAQLAVTNYSLEPASLISGDTGSLMVTVKNTGDEPVRIHSASLESPCEGFRILNKAAYDTVGTLGPGDSMAFTFTFQAGVADGTYYPKFYLDLTDGGSFRMFIPVNVKSTGLTVAVSKLPDSFNEGVRARFNITVGNPRDNEINGVRITPVTDSAVITPGTGFVGTLAADAAREVSFEVTPEKETAVTFMVTYHNGINDHTQNITVPIRFSTDKLGAEVVLNNVGIENGASYNTLSGDINNAGLTSAYAVTVTVGSPAKAVDPNRIYVIGELEPDDFASFEVTYTGAAATVPVIVTYKDADGNTFTRTIDAATSQGGFAPGSGASAQGPSSSGSSAQGSSSGRGGFSFFGMGGRSTGTGGSIPLLQAGIVIAIALGILAVAWKKGYILKRRVKAPRQNGGEGEGEGNDDHTDR